MAVDPNAQVGTETGAALLLPDVLRPGTRRRLSYRLGESSLQLWIASGVAVVIVVACFLVPLFGLPNPDTTSLTPGAAPIGTSGHLLGTDDLGRDMLSRVLHGGQISIEVGLGSVIIGLLIGGGLGLFAGYFGGKIPDQVISRILDMLLAFPALVLALAVAAYLGPNERNEIFAISFFTIPGYGRLTRSAVLRLREEDFITANRAIGSPALTVMFRHVVPNIMGSLLTFGLFTLSASMLAEAGLSYLGAGIRTPTPSWGNMISEGQEFLRDAPHIFLVPAVFLLVTILAINLIGDGLRSKYEL